MNAIVWELLAVPAPRVVPVVLLLLHTRW